MEALKYKTKVTVFLLLLLLCSCSSTSEVTDSWEKVVDASIKSNLRSSRVPHEEITSHGAFKILVEAIITGSWYLDENQINSMVDILQDLYVKKPLLCRKYAMPSLYSPHFIEFYKISSPQRRLVAKNLIDSMFDMYFFDGKSVSKADRNNAINSSLLSAEAKDLLAKLNMQSDSVDYCALRSLALQKIASQSGDIKRANWRAFVVDRGEAQ